MVIRQTDGKTLKENIFVVKKNEDVDMPSRSGGRLHDGI